MKRTTFSIIITLTLSIISLQITHAQVVFEHGDGALSVAFSPVDGTLLASGSLDGTVKLWDVVNQTDVATLEGHAALVASVAFSPNGMLLASASGDTVKLWNVNTHANIATLKGHAAEVASVAFSPDGRTLAAGASDGMVKLWDVATHKNTATFGGHSAAILDELGGWWTPVSFLSNTTLAAGAGDRIKLWDVVTEENIATFEVPGDLVDSVSFSPDGTTLAAGLESGLIKLWDVATLTNTITLPSVSTAFFVPPTFIAFSPDGTLLASTVDENVVLWEVETETQINTLSGHTNVVRSVSFSLDGSLLASGAFDGTVRLWDPSSSYGGSPPQEGLVASTAFPLTEVTLHGSVVTLTLNGQRFVDDEWAIPYAISVSGIESVAVSSSYFGVNRISDTQVTVELEFDGTDFDTDATLAFTVGADAIVDGNDQGLTALIPVTAIQNSNATVSIAPSPVVSPDVGEQLTFSINIKDGEDIVGYQIILSFDSTALNFVRRTDGDYGDYLPVDTFFSGGGGILAAKTLAGAANGNGTLATLTFRVVDFKPSTVTLFKVYLVDADGNRWEATTENAEITIPAEPAEALFGDINRDGVVNIQDLRIVGVRLGERGENSADLNGDHLVDIVDLVLVANAFGADAAAPSLYPQILEQLTAADVKNWLTQANQ